MKLDLTEFHIELDKAVYLALLRTDERYHLALRLLREERERSERLGEAPSRGSHRHFNGAGMCICCLHEDTPGDLPPCRDCTMTVHALGWEPK